MSSLWYRHDNRYYRLIYWFTVYVCPPCNIDMTTGTTDSYIDSQYIYVHILWINIWVCSTCCHVYITRRTHIYCESIYESVVPVVMSILQGDIYILWINIWVCSTCCHVYMYYRLIYWFTVYMCPCDIDMTTGTTDSYIDSQYMFPPCDIDMTTGTTD
jgi:hypothetical protein